MGASTDVGGDNTEESSHYHSDTSEEDMSEKDDESEPDEQHVFLSMSFGDEKFMTKDMHCSTSSSTSGVVSLH